MSWPESDEDARAHVKRALAKEHSFRPNFEAVARRATEIRSRRRVAMILAGVSVSVVILSTPFVLDLPRTASPPPDTDVEAGDSPTLSVAQRIPMTAVSDVGFDDGALWAASNDKVVRFSSSGEPIASIATPGSDYPKLGFGAGAVWVADRSGSLVEIDPAVNEVVARIPLPGSPTGIAIGDGSVWVSVASEAGGRVFRVDAESHEVVARISVGHGPGPVAVTEAGVWVVNSSDGGSLSLIDLSTNTVIQTTQNLGANRCLLEVDSTLWVCADASSLLRVDEVTGAQLARIEMDGEPTSVVAYRGAIWVSLNHSGEAGAPPGDLIRVDPETSAAEPVKVVVGEAPVAMATDGNVIWVASFSSGTIERIE